MRLVSYSILLILGLSACVSETEVLTPNVQTQIERRAAEGILGAQAILESNVFKELDEAEYPIMVALPGVTVNLNNGKLVDTLNDYLREQELSREAFLAHPLLDEFVRTHIVKDFVDIGKIRTSEGESFTFTNMNGDEVSFTTKDLTPTSGIFLNGVAFGTSCSIQNIGLYPETGQVCRVAAPIEEFDWSQ